MYAALPESDDRENAALIRIFVSTALALAAVFALHPSAVAAAAPVPEARALYSDAPNGMYLLDQTWSTRADPSNTGVRDGWFKPDATDGFRPVTLPDAFNKHDLSRRSFRGRVQWYRVRFAPPAAEGVAQWRFRFESVNVDATVWLNGEPIGRHRGAYLPFELAVNPSDVRAGDNELVVRVDSRGSPNDLPPSNRPRGWWNFGGILREVYLRAVRSFELGDLRVTAAPGEPTRARITATVRNMSGAPLPAPVKLHITGPNVDATTVADAGTTAPLETRPVDATIAMPGASEWSPQDPQLYELTVELPGGQTTVAHFGVRDWSVTRSGRIRLNGEPLTLRGASFHEQTAAHGAALTDADRTEIVRELQAINANFARQHYPPHPALLEAFDRAGIVFWEQIPVWRVREDQLRRPAYRATALAALREAILRDRNHASVMAWSVSNETLRGGAGERAYLRAARRLTRRLDPTRLLAADKSLRPLDDLPPSYRLLDAVGLNEYVGWYGGRVSQLPRDLAAAHRKLPGVALVVTEFGAEANRPGPASRKGTYAFQARFIVRHLAVFDRTRYLSGALIWVLRDFAVRPGWTGGNPHPRPPILFKGLSRQDLTQKLAAGVVRYIFAQ